MNDNFVSTDDRIKGRPTLINKPPCTWLMCFFPLAVIYIPLRMVVKMATDDFCFIAIQRDLMSCISSKNENSSTKAIENLFSEYPGSDIEKKGAVDQAFRNSLKTLLETASSSEAAKNKCDATNEDDSMSNGDAFDLIVQHENLIKLVILHAKEKLCTNNLPILLLSDVFDTLTLSDCERMFEFVENNVATWTSEPFFSTGKNHLLRMCNDILRRLSKSQNTIFCGRIQLFLAQLFPVEEKSALNLMSNFHMENVTIYKKNPSEFLDDFNSDNMDTSAEDGELTSNPVDYNLYVKFWSLQDFFRSPPQCYTNSGWRTLKGNITEVRNIIA